MRYLLTAAVLITFGSGCSLLSVVAPVDRNPDIEPKCSRGNELPIIADIAVVAATVGLTAASISNPQNGSSPMPAIIVGVGFAGVFGFSAHEGVVRDAACRDAVSKHDQWKRDATGRQAEHASR